MKSFILDGFLHLDTIFKDYVAHNPMLQESAYYNFMLFNQYFTDVSYEYLPASGLTYEQIRQVYISKSPEMVIGNVLCHLYFDSEKCVEQHRTDTAIFTVINPARGPDAYVAALIVKYPQPVALNGIEERFNFNYLEQLCYRIQMVIVNYEKLFLIIDSFSEMLSTKENYLPYHMSNVANWCIKISHELQLSPRDHLILYASAILHDVGMLSIPDELVTKTGILTASEYEQVKLHSEKGYMILKAVFYGTSYLIEVPDVVKHHHEHFDGGGYPDGLKSESIPYLSRILCIADAVDAMMSSKSYKRSKTVNESIRELIKGSGTLFDPKLTKVVVGILEGSKEHANVVMLNQSKFVNCASVSFNYIDLKSYLSYSGNLILKNDQGILILNSSEYLQENLEISKVHNVSLSFFENHDFYEFSASIVGIEDNRLELSDLSYVPTDRYFSMVWNSSIHLISKKNHNLEAEMLKLGGDSIVFQVPNHKNKVVTNLFKDVFDIKFNSDLMLPFELQIGPIPNIITKYYRAGMMTVYVTKFEGITSTERDSILRVLFRKQTNLRKQNTITK